AGRSSDGPAGVARIEQVLDKYCLAHVQISPESRVKVAAGAAAARLVEQGWRTFLVRVDNEAGVTAELRVGSPNAGKLANSPADEIRDRWLDLVPDTAPPMAPKLSGLGREYRVLSVYSRDAGQREGKLIFDVGQGTQDLGFRSEVDILFTAEKAAPVTFRLSDENGKPTTASLVIRDGHGRVYPSQAKRLAPDMAFQPQVYRADGETVRLPPGTYQIDVSRGPEYLVEHRAVTIASAAPREIAFHLRRWIDPAAMGWYSGDHHIHAAGCAHYSKPTEGVLPSDMIRHCMGEDLKVGCNLTWGPCFDFQKQFFTGQIDKVSQYPYLLRYDIEISGFGSHQSGHLVLLRLKQEIYPGGDSDKHWPTLCLNALRWAKKQGAVCGPAHSGWGLKEPTADLPNYFVPPYDGIGACEYIVDVTHQVEGPEGKLIPADDFLSLVDTPYVWELNMWYHTLNCGYRTRGSGETDFPCIYGERVGMGRSYVKLNGRLDYDDWCQGIAQGRNYVSDGRSHLLDFEVGGVSVGEHDSQLNLTEPGAVTVKAKVAALLDAQPHEDVRNRPYDHQPYWSIERARIPHTRQVPVELIVNGYPVARRMIEADGRLQDIEFSADIRRSSWVALRILPSSHTNPVFVVVDGKPIRASRRSARWCLDGVDQCWSQKKRWISAAEMNDAEQAYGHARQAYRQILAESDAD
ncbi:MAG TPA: CehA/McbA family metallohydrolase, partial [Tepidisphaeraceae bacterium]